jgi:hypothetical protein
MAELMIKVKRDSRPDPFFQDGDIMAAFNNRRIKDTHACHICHKNLIGFTPEGLRPQNSLTEFYLSKVKKFKFVRSGTSCTRITLATMDEEDVSDLMDVGLFIERRLAHTKHLIFGTPGNEIWYGGSTDASNKQLDLVWDEIESKTINRRSDFTRWPFTSGEIKNYLCLAVDDFVDSEVSVLEESVFDNTDPERPILTKRRKRKVSWKSLLGISGETISDIEDKDTSVDIRDVNTFSRSQIVEIKS